MTKEEIKIALIEKGWSLESHLLNDFMADALYSDIRDIFISNSKVKTTEVKKEQSQVKIDYKQEMIEYAKQRGL